MLGYRNFILLLTLALLMPVDLLAQQGNGVESLRQTSKATISLLMAHWRWTPTPPLFRSPTILRRPSL